MRAWRLILVLLCLAPLAAHAGDYPLVDPFPGGGAGEGMAKGGGEGGGGSGQALGGMGMGMGFGMAQMFMNQQQHQQPAAAAPAAAAGPSVMDRLKQLNELKTAGLITDDEFNSKKAELLKKLV